MLILRTADCSCLHLPDTLSASPDLEVAFCPRAVSPVSILTQGLKCYFARKPSRLMECLQRCAFLKLGCFWVPGCLQTRGLFPLSGTFQAHTGVSGHWMPMSWNQTITVLSILEMSIFKSKVQSYKGFLWHLNLFQLGWDWDDEWSRRNSAHQLQQCSTASFTEAQSPEQLRVLMGMIVLTLPTGWLLRECSNQMNSLNLSSRSDYRWL